MKLNNLYLYQKLNIKNYFLLKKFLGILIKEKI